MGRTQWWWIRPFVLSILTLRSFEGNQLFPPFKKSMTVLYIKKIRYVLVAQSYPALCDPMDCSPSGSSVHGISQARILEQVVISSSRGSFQPRDRTWVSYIAGGFFTLWTTKYNKHGCTHWWLKSRELSLETLMCLSQIAYLWNMTTLWNFVHIIPLPSCMVSFYPCISLAMCYFILVLWAFTSTVTYCTCLCNLLFFLSTLFFWVLFMMLLITPACFYCCAVSIIHLY